MKTLFVILLLSISTSVLSQQVPSESRANQQIPHPPTAPQAMTNSTGSSTGNTTSIPMTPSGLNETYNDDIKKLLSAQTEMMKTLAVQIRRLDNQIHQIKKRVAILESETE